MRSPLFRVVLLAAAVAAASGCTPMQTKALLEHKEQLALPQTAMNESVPFIPQEELYCGPAATAMALNATGLSIDQDMAADLVFTPGREGTRRSDVVAAVRRYGRFGVPVADLRDLLYEVSAGNPVIVFQNLGLDLVPRWHFAVAVGYDLGESESLILHSGTRRAHRVSFATFERTWARGDYWALAVTAPDILPHTADTYEALVAAAGIARSGDPASAVAGFHSVAERWPGSFEAHMGLGNALYAADRLADAEQAFRTAATLRPGAPEPWNNLAYALLRQARDDEARAAARMAVKLAPREERFRETLREISLAS